MVFSQIVKIKTLFYDEITKLWLYGIDINILYYMANSKFIIRIFSYKENPWYKPQHLSYLVYSLFKKRYNSMGYPSTFVYKTSFELYGIWYFHRLLKSKILFYDEIAKLWLYGIEINILYYMTNSKIIIRLFSYKEKTHGKNINICLIWYIAFSKNDIIQWDIPQPLFYMV